MKKVEKEQDPDMLPEYDFSKGVRGKYANRYAANNSVRILESNAPDLEDTASRLAPGVAKLLSNAAHAGTNEADFRREAAHILEEAGAEAGLTIVPRDEFSVARGRVDSLYNRLILEVQAAGCSCTHE